VRVDVNDAFKRLNLGLAMCPGAQGCERATQQEHKLNSLHENLSELGRHFQKLFDI
jgi:hypothetical protein